MQRVFRLLLLTAVLGWSSIAVAQPAFVGNNFVVNSYTTAVQSYARGCTTAAGRFVVSWTEPGSYRYGPDGRDGSGSGLFGRRVSANGVPLDTDFAINTYTLGSQGSQLPVCLSGGNFVIVWRDFEDYVYNYPYGGSYFGRSQATAQMYDGDGTPIGTDFEIEDERPYSQPVNPSAACNNGDNQFVVLWSGSSYNIHGKRFDALGQPVGTTFTIDTNYSIATGPTCCGGPAGFVVAWSAQGSGTYAYQEVVGQRFSTAAQPLGTLFQANTYTTLSQYRPAVGCDDTGRFVITWESGMYGYSSPVPTQDGDGLGVFGQRYDAQGDPAGTEFQANTSTANNEGNPKVALDTAGNFLIAWDAQNFGGAATLGQAFDWSGNLIGTEMFISASVANLHIRPDVMARGSGNFLVVWHVIDLGVDDDDVWGQLINLDGTVTTSTTMPATTTTTMSSGGLCGDPVDPGGSLTTSRATITAINATDALFTLEAGVGSRACELCVCDVNNSGDINASDALLALQFGVGQPVALTCPPCT